MEEEQKPLLIHRRSASPVEEPVAVSSPRPVLKESDMTVKQTYKLYWDILKNPYVGDECIKNVVIINLFIYYGYDVDI